MTSEEFEKFEAMVNTLEESSVLLINDEDRDYVRGVKLLLDMSEVVTPEMVKRIVHIYTEFTKLQLTL